MTVISLYQRLQLMPLGREVHILLIGRIGRRGRRASVVVEQVDRGDRRGLHARVSEIASEHGIRWIDDPAGIVNRDRGPCSYLFEGASR